MEVLTKMVPARVDVVILGSDRQVKGDSILVAPGERDLVELAFNAYIYCLKDEAAVWPSRLSLADFADKIERVMDCASDSVNGAVVAALRSVHGRMAAAVAAGQEIQVRV